LSVVALRTFLIREQIVAKDLQQLPRATCSEAARQLPHASAGDGVKEHLPT